MLLYTGPWDYGGSEPEWDGARERSNQADVWAAEPSRGRNSANALSRDNRWLEGLELSGEGEGGEVREVGGALQARPGFRVFTE